MKILKALLEDVRAYNMDTEEELDLDALADLDLDALLGGEYMDTDGSDVVGGLEFSDDTAGTSLADTDLFADDDFDSMELSGDALELGQGGDDTMGLDVDGTADPDMDFDAAEDDLFDETEETDFDDMSQNQADDIANGDPDAENPNADFQGEIRTVRGANLVFKRKMDDGNFEELWIYNVGNDIKRETQIRRAILAGTDIDPGSQESKDGQQRADTTTAGNVQFLHITGLPQ